MVNCLSIIEHNKWQSHVALQGGKPKYKRYNPPLEFAELTPEQKKSLEILKSGK